MIHSFFWRFRYITRLEHNQVRKTEYQILLKEVQRLRAVQS